eukprot:scaffold420_cov169-Ochromonas_danica.AAC.17
MKLNESSDVLYLIGTKDFDQDNELALEYDTMKYGPNYTQLVAPELTTNNCGQAMQTSPSSLHQWPVSGRSGLLSTAE